MYEGLTTHLTNRTTLTKKEQLILLYFSSFRFLTAKLLQQLMNQKDIRFIRSWLHHLVNLGFIKVINTSEVETLYKAAIYCLTPSSRSLLIKHSIRKNEELRFLSKETSRSRSFIEHQLKLCEIYLQLRKLRSEEDTEFNFYTIIDLYGFRVLNESFIIIYSQESSV